MDSKEIKNIFKKFYRTQRAEQSGEVGTGIGLSIVEQIVTHHGGRMEVTSEPGKGPCFTMGLKSAIVRSSVAETINRRGCPPGSQYHGDRGGTRGPPPRRRRLHPPSHRATVPRALYHRHFRYLSG